MNINVKKQHVLLGLISFFIFKPASCGDFGKKNNTGTINKTITLRRGTPIIRAKVIQKNNGGVEETVVHHFNFDNQIEMETTGLNSKKVIKYSFKDIKKITFYPDETSVPKNSEVSSMQKSNSSDAYVKIKVSLNSREEESLLKLNKSIFSGYLDGTEESMACFSIVDIHEIQILETSGYVGEKDKKKCNKKIASSNLKK